MLNDFVAGAIYGSTAKLIEYISDTSSSEFSVPKTIKELTVAAVSTPLSISSFDYLYDYITEKTGGKLVIPTIIGGSLVTSILCQAVSGAGKDFKSNVEDSFASSLGYNTMKVVGRSLIPQYSKSILASTGVSLLANAGSVVSTSVLLSNKYEFTLAEYALGFVKSIPTIIFENIAYQSIKRSLRLP